LLIKVVLVLDTESIDISEAIEKIALADEKLITKSRILADLNQEIKDKELDL